MTVDSGPDINNRRQNKVRTKATDRGTDLQKRV